MDKFPDVAKRAACQAGKFLLKNLGRTKESRYKGEGHKNPSSAVDEKAEDIILNILSSNFPEHNFISEEKGRKRAWPERSVVSVWLYDRQAISLSSGLLM